MKTPCQNSYNATHKLLGVSDNFMNETNKRTLNLIDPLFKNAYFLPSYVRVCILGTQSYIMELDQEPYIITFLIGYLPSVFLNAKTTSDQ